ncbi:hypothetical protein HWV62_14130 [Athelia sp. TMB]|nr:hypothetical protein HWV62_14130 [Athelia sp. TMB]
MLTGSFNPDVVEESAQTLLHYEKIMQAHLVELRKNPETLLATHDLASRCPSTQAGQRWPPESHRRDEYMRHMDGICVRHPSSDKERMEIVLAAQSAITCYTLFHVNELDPGIRTKVMGRYRDLSQEFARELMAMQQPNAMNVPSYELPVSSPHLQLPGPMITPPPHTSPYSSPSNLTRRLLTQEEKSAYSANPMKAIGRHFILDPDSADPLPYKVSGLRASEQTMIYEVLMAGSCHAEDLEQEEVESMMNDSVILE